MRFITKPEKKVGRLMSVHIEISKNVCKNPRSIWKIPIDRSKRVYLKT